MDLLRLPNFVADVDLIAQPLRRIVTGYYLDTECKSGLTGCHQSHKEGFVVELEDGGISNLGWICGSRFGEKIAIEQRRYAEQEIRPNAIRHILEVVEKIRGMRPELEQLNSLAERLSTCKQGMQRCFLRLYKELERRAHTVASLLTMDSNAPEAPAMSSEPRAMSKKQRDIYKRLQATLQSTQKRNR